MSFEQREYAEQVRRCVDGISGNGVAALAGLFDLTSQRLLRFAVTITRNQHDAEDAVQASLVKVAASPERLASAVQPWLYLLRIVRNESLLILRKRKRSNLFASLADLICQCGTDQAEQEEQFQAVWSALRGLPTEQSEVVVLKIWEQLTFAEISETLQISPSTAASRYRYALEKLTPKLRRHASPVPLAHKYTVERGQ